MSDFYQYITKSLRGVCTLDHFYSMFKYGYKQRCLLCLVNMTTSPFFSYSNTNKGLKKEVLVIKEVTHRMDQSEVILQDVLSEVKDNRSRRSSEDVSVFMEVDEIVKTAGR